MQKLVSDAHYAGAWPKDKNNIKHLINTKKHTTILITFKVTDFKTLGHYLGVMDTFRTFHKGTSCFVLFVEDRETLELTHFYCNANRTNFFF